MRNKKLKKLDNLKLENRTVGLNVKPLEPRRFTGNKKLYQYGALFVAVLMVFSSVGYATIKLGEDGSGQKWFGSDTGLITNSNGKAWAATGDNLQAAIWDLNSTGGTVWLPVGNIELTSPIMIEHDYITIKGGNRGHSTMFTKCADMPNGVFQIKGTGTGSMVSKVTLENLYFENKNANIWIYDGAFVNCTYAKAILIENCDFRFNKDEAIVMRTVWGSVIDKCYIQRCGNATNNNASILYESADGGTSVCTTPWITDNLFEAGGDWCIKNTDGFADRAHIVGNWGEYENVSGTDMPSDGYIRWDGDIATISDNKIWGDGTAWGIYSTGVGSIIQINHVQNLDYGISAGNTLVSNNQVYNCITRGIAMSGGQCLDNHLVSCGNPSVNYGRGISISNNVTCVGNTIQKGFSLFRQLYIYGDNNIVVGNKFIGNSSVSHAITFDAISDNNFVSNNQFTNVTTVMNSPLGTGNIITNNNGYDYSNYFILPSVNCTGTPPTNYLWFNATTNVLNVYNGTAWVSTTLT